MDDPKISGRGQPQINQDRNIHFTWQNLEYLYLSNIKMKYDGLIQTYRPYRHDKSDHTWMSPAILHLDAGP